MATPDRDAAIPPSTWDAMMAAVHEELAKLPENQRVPFVLCCLEGKATTEAAEQLGWKLGTFSGRLTRAKQTLLERLEKRGLPLTAGTVLLGSVSAPATAVAKVFDLIHARDVIPSTILEIAKGATMSKTKLLAAAILVAVGFTASIGGWLMTADAQTPTEETEKRVKAFKEMMNQARQASSKWEYKYEAQHFETDTLNTILNDFQTVIEKHEAEGWTYLGQLKIEFPNKLKQHHLVFRRPKGIDRDAQLQGLPEYQEMFLQRYLAEERLQGLRLTTENPVVDSVRAIVLQRMQKDPKETFAAALNAKLKASPEYKDAVEKYGIAKLEEEVKMTLLERSRKSKWDHIEPGVNLFPPTAPPTAGGLSEAAEIQKEIEELRAKARDRKKVTFWGKDYGLGQGEIEGVVMRAIRRKFDPKLFPNRFETTTGGDGNSSHIDVVGSSADIEWLKNLMESAKPKK